MFFHLFIFPLKRGYKFRHPVSWIFIEWHQFQCGLSLISPESFTSFRILLLSACKFKLSVFFLHEHLSGKTRNKVKKSKRENQISKRWMQNKRQNKLEFVFQKRRVLGHICEALRYFIRDTVYKFLGFFLWTAYCQRRFYCTTNSKVSLKFVWLKKWRLVLFLRCFAVRMEKFSQRSLDGVN